MSDSVENHERTTDSARVQPAKRLTEAETAALAEQIAGLTAAGLPLPGGLRAMAEEMPSGGFRRVLVDLATRLEHGVPLDAALDQMGRSLPEHLRGLVRAGVRSGRLGEILSQYVRYHSRAVQLRRKTASSLAYPLALFIVFWSIFSFMIILIVPKFKKIFMDFGVELPPITLSLLYFSDWCVDFWRIWLGVFLAVSAVGWFLSLLAFGSPWWQRLLYRLPMVGRLQRLTRLAQFARVLAMLVESEVPLPAALQLAGGAIRDAEIADAARQLAGEVEAGQSLADSETRRSRFPGGLAQSLQWGEGTQSLAESLRTAAEMLESRAMIHSEFVFRVAPPLTMIVIVSVLAFVVTGLFMPLIKLITELSG